MFISYPILVLSHRIQEALVSIKQWNKLLKIIKVETAIYNMRNSIIIDNMKESFFASFKQLEFFIEICPIELWNKEIIIPGEFGDGVSFCQFLFDQFCLFAFLVKSNHQLEILNHTQILSIGLFAAQRTVY